MIRATHVEGSETYGNRKVLAVPRRSGSGCHSDGSLVFVRRKVTLSSDTTM